MDTAKKLLRQVYLDQAVKHLVLNLGLLRRRALGVDRRLVAGYLRAHATRKLHIGCGGNLHPGWLNSDLFPKSDAILHLDATRPFPLPDASFDYIFSEHMIEHVPYGAGHAMLRECMRVLKPGGRLRISTPDLRFLVDLCGSRPSAVQAEYIEWATRSFVPGAPYSDAVFVVNNFVRDWGHTFVYDEPTLRRSMERAGFRDVTACELGSSRDPNLHGLEHATRIPLRFLALESMTLEATKPTAP